MLLFAVPQFALRYDSGGVVEFLRCCHWLTGLLSCKLAQARRTCERVGFAALSLLALSSAQAWVLTVL